MMIGPQSGTLLSTSPSRGEVGAQRRVRGDRNSSETSSAPHPDPLPSGERESRGRAAGALLMRHVIGAVCAFIAFAVMADAARAHPHVWIVAKSELVYAPDGSLTGVRHAWTFDDMFSAYALQGLETKTKGVYTREELAPLAQTNVESLKEFGYFTFAKTGAAGSQKKQKFAEPVDYYLDYKDAALTLHFVLPLKAPVKAETLAIEVFDPAYFIDFQLNEKEPVTLVGAPAGCKLAIQRPTDGTAQAQKLGEDMFQSGDNSNYGAMFANKITVDCPR